MKKIKANQQIRLDIMRNYIDGVISAIKGAQSLEISERHFRRLVKAFTEKGLESLFHGNIGSIPKNKIDDFTRRRIIKLYKTKYLGFNLTHFREKLYELEGLNYVPSYTSLRTILASEKIYAPQPKMRRKIHSRRARYECEGVMIQIDGSHHQWIAGHTPFCLTCAVDDASGRIVGAKFTPTETTFASMDVVEHPTLTTLYGQMIEVRVYRNGRIRFFYQNEEVEAKALKEKQAV